MSFDWQYGDMVEYKLGDILGMFIKWIAEAADGRTHSRGFVFLSFRGMVTNFEIAYAANESEWAKVE